MPRVQVEIYDEREETTSIETAILLGASKTKQWLLTPFLSIVTLFVWPLVLYWSVIKQRDWLYKTVDSIDQATYIYLESRDGNREIVHVYDSQERSDQLVKEAKNRFGNAMIQDGLSIYFTYRFINF